MWGKFFIIFILLMQAACSMGSTAPVVKIGLVAPFEGRYRAIGYEAIYAARLAIREVNRAGGVNGVRVELFALDDSGERQMAFEQARKLAIDERVVAVIGHFRPDTTSIAIDVYCDKGLPLLAIDSTRSDHCTNVFSLTPAISNRREAAVTDAASFTFVATVPHPNDLPEANAFVEAYNSIPIDGTQPGPIALQTYDAMYLLFDALERSSRSGDVPSREGMVGEIGDSGFEGLGGEYRFDARGERVDAEMFTYQYPGATLLRDEK